MDKLPISVCILCKNEEDRLHRCLKALRGFEEVIVADTGSKDNSIEVCKQYDVVLYQDSWVNFAENRKKLFKRATQPWILWLDADEVVTQDLIEELQILFSKDINMSAFQLNRMVYFEGQWIKHGGWFPDWCMRLFKTDAWTMKMNAVHESLLIQGDIGKLNSLLEHYSFRDWKDLKKRSIFYQSLWLKDKLDRSKRATIFTAYSHAVFAFIKDYLLRRGFLDGRLGLKIACHHTHEVYQKYKELARFSK